MPASIDLPFGEPRERLLERDAPLEARQRGPQAEVDAVAERDVVVDAAVDVEAIGIGELALVAIGGAGEQQHLRAGGHDLAVQLDVAGRPSALHRRRRLEAQELLDRVRDQPAVGGELLALLGVLGQDDRREAEQPRDRLGPRADDEVREVAGLCVGEPANGAVVVGDLRVGEIGEHVVDGLPATLLELTREVLVEPDHGVQRHVVDHADARLDVEDQVDVVTDLLALFGRHTEQRRDDHRRQLRTEVLHEVERPATRVRVEHLGAQLADPALELLDAPRREGTRGERPQAGVLGWVDEDELAGVEGLGRHHLEDGAVPRAERDRVEVGGFDVGVPAQRPEVVLVVAVERRLVTQATPDLVRLGVDVGVERVP